MYTIRQASIRSGVPVALLRAWERRYGVVVPARTASGYRLYDDTSIARLIAMRKLVDAGWTASQAAGEVLRVESPAAVTADTGPAASAVPGRYAAEAGADLVSAASQYDAAGVEQALDRLFARGTFEAVIDDLVLPAVAALGASWAAGTLDIAAEHLASEAVQRRLAALFNAASAVGAGPPVLVGLPPGDLHEIGALAFAIALRRRGFRVLYLGPDVPVSSWVHAVVTADPQAAVIGVGREADAPAAVDVASAVLAANPSVLVAAGGPAAGLVRPSVVLRDRVADAALEVAERLSLPAEGPPPTARGRATARGRR